VILLQRQIDVAAPVAVHSVSLQYTALPITMHRCLLSDLDCTPSPHVLAGMPYPQNLQTALEVEEVVRQHGAVPATIAIIGGQPCIGGVANARRP
jgi:hypothetical protein